VIFQDAKGKTLKSSSLPGPPYRIEMKAPTAPSSSKKRKETESAVPGTPIEDVIVTHYDPPNPGPYPEDQPPKNKVRFTPVQIEAVRSGINPVSHFSFFSRIIQLYLQHFPFSLYTPVTHVLYFYRVLLWLWVLLVPARQT
jgi:Intron-binding protein aquarius N-terminus